MTPTVVKCEYDSGDTAFMSAATAFVMLQTPAMGIAQAGLLRRKNALSMMMQTISGMAIISLLWFLCGYSLTFGPSLGGFIGGLSKSFFMGIVGPHECSPSAPRIPEAIFAGFQMMFSLMTPVIVTGAWAEKMTFEAFLVFVTLWPFAVYYPAAHWIWNIDGFLSTYGVQDFAGGAVIHASSGFAGAVVAYMLQRRKPREHANDQGHSLPLTVLGTSIIWAGWYSFNGGSAYMAGLQASVALLNTHLSACTGGLVWTLMAYRKDGKWHLLEMLSGALAGLAAITAGSGFVKPYAAVITGAVAGVGSRLSVDLVKERLRWDDTLDVFALQGAPGVIGMLTLGLFATPEVGGNATGVFMGGGAAGWAFLGKQTLAVCIVAVLSSVMTAALMQFMKRTVGIDVSSQIEEVGLDLAQIGETAYDTQLESHLDLGTDTLTQKLFAAVNHGDGKETVALIAQGADPLASDYDGRTLAHIAAAYGRFDVLKILVEKHGAPVNERDRWNGTPLQDAVRGNHSSCVAYLRSKGGTMDDADFGRDIMAAAARGAAARVGELLRLGISPDYADYDFRTPLMVASAEGHAAVVELLLANGASVHAKDRWGRTAVHDAAKFHHDAIVHILTRHLSGPRGGGGADDTVQISTKPSKKRSWGATAAATGDEDALLQPLMQQPTSGNLSRSTGDRDVNSDGDGGDTHGDLEAGLVVHAQEIPAVVITAATRELCAAASVGDLGEVKRLIAKNGSINVADYDHRTPLHLAVSGNHKHVVAYLLSLDGVNVNAMDRWNRSPLHDALDHRCGEIVKMLRQAGCTTQDRYAGFQLCKAAFEGDLDSLGKMLNGGTDLNISDYDGRTALHLAACRGDTDIVRWLLDHGAVATVTDRYNTRPEEDAEREGHTETAAVLRSAFETTRKCQ